MNSIVVYPTTDYQFSVVQEFLEKMRLAFTIKKTRKHDDSLYTKEAYFAMLDERIRNAERGNVVELTPELEEELFGSVL